MRSLVGPSFRERIAARGGARGESDERRGERRGAIESASGDRREKKGQNESGSGQEKRGGDQTQTKTLISATTKTRNVFSIVDVSPRSKKRLQEVLRSISHRRSIFFLIIIEHIVSLTIIVLTMIEVLITLHTRSDP